MPPARNHVLRRLLQRLAIATRTARTHSPGKVNPRKGPQAKIRTRRSHQHVRPQRAPTVEAVVVRADVKVDRGHQPLRAQPGGRPRQNQRERGRCGPPMRRIRPRPGRRMGGPGLPLSAGRKQDGQPRGTALGLGQGEGQLMRGFASMDRDRPAGSRQDPAPCIRDLGLDAGLRNRLVGILDRACHAQRLAGQKSGRARVEFRDFHRPCDAQRQQRPPQDLMATIQSLRDDHVVARRQRRHSDVRQGQRRTIGLRLHVGHDRARQRHAVSVHERGAVGCGQVGDNADSHRRARAGNMHSPRHVVDRLRGQSPGLHLRGRPAHRSIHSLQNGAIGRLDAERAGLPSWTLGDVQRSRT